VDDRAVAMRLLLHYIRFVWQKAGIEWTGDNEAEVLALGELLTRHLARPEPPMGRGEEVEG
jgi:hypothetical protein